MVDRKVDINVDNIIDKLLTLRGSKAIKQVNLLEN